MAGNRSFKLILAIEAIGYDPRDISSVNLLDAVGNRNGDNYLNTEYAIHAIKSGGYTSSTLLMMQWQNGYIKELKVF